MQVLRSLRLPIEDRFARYSLRADLCDFSEGRLLRMEGFTVRESIRDISLFFLIQFVLSIESNNYRDAKINPQKIRPSHSISLLTQLLDNSLTAFASRVPLLKPPAHSAKKLKEFFQPRSNTVDAYSYYYYTRLLQRTIRSMYADKYTTNKTHERTLHSPFEDKSH